MLFFSQTRPLWALFKKSIFSPSKIPKKLREGLKKVIFITFVGGGQGVGLVCFTLIEYVVGGGQHYLQIYQYINIVYEVKMSWYMGSWHCAVNNAHGLSTIRVGSQNNVQQFIFFLFWKLKSVFDFSKGKNTFFSKSSEIILKWV